jgi:hypothetical protein
LVQENRLTAFTSAVHFHSQVQPEQSLSTPYQYLDVEITGIAIPAASGITYPYVIMFLRFLISDYVKRQAPEFLHSFLFSGSAVSFCV